MNAPVNLDAVRQAGREIAALAYQIRELCGDDDLAFVDTLDGETDAIQAARGAVRMVQAMEALAEASDALSDRYKARAKDFSDRAGRARSALLQFMGEIGETKLVLPEATVSVGKGRPHLVGEPDVEALPEEFVRVKREPNRSAISEALKAGREVPGCALSNAAPVLSLRVR